MIGPSSFTTKPLINQQILCSMQLFTGKCQIVHMKVADVPNLAPHVGVVTCLFALCVLDSCLGYYVYELLPPLNSLYLALGSTNVSKALLQPLVLLHQGLFEASKLLSESTESNSESFFRLLHPSQASSVELENLEKALMLITAVDITSELDLLVVSLSAFRNLECH